MEPDQDMRTVLTQTIKNGDPEVPTAYFAYSAFLMGKAAERLNKKDEATYYLNLSQKIRNAYRAYFVKDGHIYSNRQAKYVRPIALDLLAPEEKQSAADALNELVKPVMTTKEDMKTGSKKSKILKAIFAGAIVGFICGFVGAGGGMMMLLLLTSLMGYELKTAVGTSVFIMTFTALTGSVSHFAIGGAPSWLPFTLCIVFTLVFARIAAKIANKASPKTLNRVTGIILVILGVVVLSFSFFTK